MASSPLLQEHGPATCPGPQPHNPNPHFHYVGRHPGVHGGRVESALGEPLGVEKKQSPGVGSQSGQQ